MEEKIEGQSFVMPRLGLGEQLLSEYEIEIEYWGTHLEEVMAGEYKPLWKQRAEGLI